MHYPHVTLRHAGLQALPVAWVAWRRLPACVEASSPLPSGAGRGRWCAGTNLVQRNVYAQVSHTCLTDSMIGTIPSSTAVTRMGNGVPRAGSWARLVRQHGCRTPNCATRAWRAGTAIHQARDSTAGAAPCHRPSRSQQHLWRSYPL